MRSTLTNLGRIIYKLTRCVLSVQLYHTITLLVVPVCTFLAVGVVVANHFDWVLIPVLSTSHAIFCVWLCWLGVGHTYSDVSCLRYGYGDMFSEHAVEGCIALGPGDIPVPEATMMPKL